MFHNAAIVWWIKLINDRPIMISSSRNTNHSHCNNVTIDNAVLGNKEHHWSIANEWVIEGGVVGKQSRSVYYTPSARRVVYYSLQMKPRIQFKLGLRYTEKHVLAWNRVTVGPAVLTLDAIHDTNCLPQSEAATRLRRIRAHQSFTPAEPAVRHIHGEGRPSVPRNKSPPHWSRWFHRVCVGIRQNATVNSYKCDHCWSYVGCCGVSLNL